MSISQTPTKFSLHQGDITQVQADAIVNAANTSLLGGGGVDGDIHRAGGSAILDDCRRIIARQGGCKVGQAVITCAGRLPARYVIHTVGPRWNGGDHDEVALLKSAYDSCFTLVAEYGIKTIAFPNISTGIYRFPKVEAAEIAIAAMRAAIDAGLEIDEIKIVCFEAESFAIYQRLLADEQG